MRNILLSFICIASLTACNNPSANSNKPAETAAAPAPKGPVQSKLDEAGTKALMNVVNAYYEVKNAMVATKAADATTAATKLSVAADSMAATLQKDSTNMAALKQYVDTIQMQSKAIAAIQDESCEKQRLALGTLSSAMYGMLKAADLKNAGVYHEYCPMAFNNKGAYWLSSESEIKNPYFGKKMLECGEVTDSLK